MLSQGLRRQRNSGSYKELDVCDNYGLYLGFLTTTIGANNVIFILQDW
jgi:hypothetical protein